MLPYVLPNVSMGNLLDIKGWFCIAQDPPFIIYGLGSNVLAKTWL